MALKKSQRDGRTPAAEPSRTLPELLLLIDSVTAGERQTAILALAEHTISAPVLCQRLEVEDDTACREGLAMALIKIGGPVVVSSLLPYLKSDDAVLRNIVIDILKELPADVAPHMESLLVDPDSDVRIFVINVLEALRHPNVESWLIAVIRIDSHVNVVATALDLLSEVGTESSLSALQGISARFPDEPFISFAATKALERIQRTAT
jgi:HEAT repeat protein